MGNVLEFFLSNQEDIIQAISNEINKDFFEEVPVDNPKIKALVESYYNEELLIDHIEKIATSKHAKELSNLLFVMSNLLLKDAFQDEREVITFGFVKVVYENNKTDISERINRLRAILDKTTEIEAKSSIIRILYIADPLDNTIEEEFIDIMKNKDLDDTVRMHMYFEFLRIKLENLDDEEDYLQFKKFLNEAREKYPDIDLFYEIEGDIGVYLMEENKEDAKVYFENVYTWIVYRCLADLDKTYLSLNFLYYLSRYAEILIEENNEEKAKDILNTAQSLIDKYSDVFKEKPEVFEHYLEDLNDVNLKFKLKFKPDDIFPKEFLD